MLLHLYSFVPLAGFFLDVVADDVAFVSIGQDELFAQLVEFTNVLHRRFFACVDADVHFFFVTCDSIVHVEHVVAVVSRSLCQTGEVHAEERLLEHFSFFPSDNVVITVSFEAEFDGAFATYFEDHAFVRVGDISITGLGCAQIGVGVCVGGKHVDVGHAHAVADFLDGDFASA